MNGNPDPEKLFRMLAETGRLIALDDLDDVGDGVINNDTPLPGMSSAPHHWAVGCGLMIIANEGQKAIKYQQMNQQEEFVQMQQKQQLVAQISEALEE